MFFFVLMLVAPRAGLAAPEAPPKPEALKRFSLALNNVQAKPALLLVGRACGELVLADSTLGRGVISADWKDVTVEDALTDACKQLGASWKRVYLPPRTVPVADNVSQLYRSLRGLYAGGIVALEPDSDRGSILLSNSALPKGTRELMEGAGNDFRRAYLVLRPNVPLTQPAADDGGPWQPGQPLSAGKFARMQRDMAAALAQMTPEERQAALGAGIEAQMAVFGQNPQLMQQVVQDYSVLQTRLVISNPQIIGAVVQGIVQGHLDVLPQMTPEQRQELRDTGRDAFRQLPPDQLMQLMILMGRRAQPQ
jgi:hypothetical protein